MDLSVASRTLAFFLKGASTGSEDIYVLINGAKETRAFRMFPGEFGDWRKIVDTFAESPDDIVEGQAASPLVAPAVDVGPESVVVLTRSVDA